MGGLVRWWWYDRQGVLKTLKINRGYLRTNNGGTLINVSGPLGRYSRLFRILFDGCGTLFAVTAVLIVVTFPTFSLVIALTFVKPIATNFVKHIWHMTILAEAMTLVTRQPLLTIFLLFSFSLFIRGVSEGTSGALDTFVHLPAFADRFGLSSLFISGVI
jgi:hypothetical protein